MKQIRNAKSAIRSLRGMPRDTSTLIRAKIEAYAADPMSQANNVKKTNGTDRYAPDNRRLARHYGSPRASLGDFVDWSARTLLRLKGSDVNEMVEIPREEYDRLRDAAEDLADLLTYDRATSALASGEEELVPASYLDRISNGEYPLRVYRDLRGMTQTDLAEKAVVHRVTIAEIETGRKHGSIATLRKLADALEVLLDDLAA